MGDDSGGKDRGGVKTEHEGDSLPHEEDPEGDRGGRGGRAGHYLVLSGREGGE